MFRQIAQSPLALGLLAWALVRHVDEQFEQEPEPAPEPIPVQPIGPTLGERFRAFWGGRAWVPAATALAVVAAIASTALFIYRERQPQTFATLTLSAAVSDRAEGVRANRVKHPIEAAALKVSLTLPEGAAPEARYRAELESGGGSSQALEASGPQGGAVTVVIPASQLPRGAYALKLYAVRPDNQERRIPGNYFFTVE